VQLDEKKRKGTKYEILVAITQPARLRLNRSTTIQTFKQQGSWMKTQQFKHAYGIE
jgi:hypothetical protein